MSSPLPPIDPKAESERITSFIKRTFESAGKSTAVIALSGGIDSALSYTLAVKALGPDHVEAFYLPAKTSNPANLNDVRALMGTAVDHLRVIPISAIIQKTWRVMKRNMSGEGVPRFPHGIMPPETDSTGEGAREYGNLRSEPQVERLRLANLAARTRMMVIYDQAKTRDALVVGTENYSEHLLGYFTRFGDEASDLEPIRHLYKTQVIALAKYLGVPQSIIDKAPSADLWPGQTDAGELGFTYEAADPILYLINQEKSQEEIIAAGFSPALTTAVYNQVKRSLFKHQVPYHL